MWIHCSSASGVNAEVHGQLVAKLRVDAADSNKLDSQCS